MNVALIMAAGVGTRMNSSLPKQFIPVNEKPLIIHTIDRFMSNPLIDIVVLVINKEETNNFNDLLEKESYNKDIYFVFGGKTRQESVFLGLKQLEDFICDDDIVLIHDGARANVSEEIITRNIESVKKYGSAITAYRPIDTIAKTTNSSLVSLNRDELLVVQTPQSFIFKDILKAHYFCQENAYTNLTDDSAVALKIGLKLNVVEGSKHNIKVTTSDDLKLLSLYIENKID